MSTTLVTPTTTSLPLAPTPMRASYEEALSLQLDGEPIVQFCEWRDDNLARIQVHTAWANHPENLRVNLLVPTVTPTPFSWDGGLHGAIVQLPGGGERFCHPRLRSLVAEEVYQSRSRAQLRLTQDWQFHWESFYDRFFLAIYAGIMNLSNSRQRMDPDLIRSRLQRQITELLSGARPEDEDEEEFNGLPATNEALILRQMYEVQLGYPSTPGDTFLKEQLKQKYLEYVDPQTCILTTGKNRVGRYVMRIRPEAPQSHYTQHPVPDFSLMINPLACVGDPKRYIRENRGIVNCHVFKEPLEPPLKAPGYRIPEPLKQRMTTLFVAFADFPGKNVYYATAEDAAEYGVAEGESICLDKVLVTRSGRQKLIAEHQQSGALTEEKWLEKREQLLANQDFEVEEVLELVEMLNNGEPLIRRQYSYRYTKPLHHRYDKLKLLVGGIKAMCAPFPQLFTQVGGEIIEVDAVVAESTVIAKGAGDALWGALAPLAGITVIDPAWTREELVLRIEAGLAERGLPTDGRLPLYQRRKEARRGRPRETAGHGTYDQLPEEVRRTLREIFGISQDTLDESLEPLGFCIAGPVAVVRPQETEYRQSDLRAGIAINIHARNCVGIPFPYSGEDEGRMAELGTFYNLAHEVTEGVEA